MNTKLLFIIFFSALVLFILYKLYNKDNNGNNILEHFGVLEKMKNISKQKKDKQKKDKFSNITSNKKSTFDDIIKASENMDPDKISINNIFNKISEYKQSFDKVKFKNNSKTTAEAFEKFGLYKEQFYNIFK
jgi:hypothetical protein